MIFSHPYYELHDVLFARHRAPRCVAVLSTSPVTIPEFTAEQAPLVARWSDNDGSRISLFKSPVGWLVSEDDEIEEEIDVHLKGLTHPQIPELGMSGSMAAKSWAELTSKIGTIRSSSEEAYVDINAATVRAVQEKAPQHAIVEGRLLSIGDEHVLRLVFRGRNWDDAFVDIQSRSKSSTSKRDSYFRLDHLPRLVDAGLPHADDMSREELATKLMGRLELEVVRADLLEFDHDDFLIRSKASRYVEGIREEIADWPKSAIIDYVDLRDALLDEAADTDRIAALYFAVRPLEHYDAGGSWLGSRFEAMIPQSDEDALGSLAFR